MTTESSTPNPDAPPAPEQVWAAFQRAADLLAENQAAVKAEAAERKAAIEAQMAAIKAQMAAIKAEAAERKAATEARMAAIEVEAAKRQAATEARMATIKTEAAERMAAIEADAAKHKAEMAEWNAWWKASMKKADRRLKAAEALFTTQWGRLMESLVDGDLLPLLQARNIAVDRTHLRMKTPPRAGDGFEIDIVAMNGVDVVAVEVKTTLRPKDVKRFLRKLSVFQEKFPEYGNHRVYGAVAYLREDSEAVQHAKKKGLFVIRATGKSASIVNEEGFEPRLFSRPRGRVEAGRVG